MTTTVIEHPRDEDRAAVALLSAAFHDDPMFRYLAPEEDGRRTWLRGFFTASLSTCSATGEVFRVAGEPAGGIVALTPPGRYPQGFRSELRALRSMLPAALRSGPVLWRRILATGLMQEMTKRHPAEPHWYLQHLAVHPASQGRGFGGVLLRHALGLADASGAPVYLETSNPNNLTLYQRFGFRVTDTFPTPRGRPPMWSLFRPVA